MNDYKELIELLANPTDGRDNADIMICAADAIEQLVRERDGWMIAYDGAQRAYHEWFAEAQKLMKERDAAVKDLFEEADSRFNTCIYCKKDADCVLDCDNALWEWRGVQE